MSWASESAGFLANRYGSFCRESGAFVVTDPRTPRPWVNVLANELYGVVLSQAGGGFSWADNCQLFRLTRWDQDLAQDLYGRWLYLLELDADGQAAGPAWSPAFLPTRIPGDRAEVEHGLGYTTFRKRFGGVLAEQTVFVPTDVCGEVWSLRLTNEGSGAKRLRVAAALEWFLGGQGDWHREFHKLFVETRTEGNRAFAWKHPGLNEGARTRPEVGPTAVFAVHGAEPRWVVDRLRWLGPVGTVAAPDGLFEVPTEAGSARWDDPGAAAVMEIALKPGEARTLTFVLGAGADVAEATALADRFAEGADAALAETAAYWSGYVARQPVKTGDEATDFMCRTWLPYQAVAGRLMARCAFYQQGGAYGYRDQLQDSLMLKEMDPDRTLEQLLRHAGAMYEDGGVRHWWHPGTSVFVPSHHSDTCLWLAYGVATYLEATGNDAALDLRAPILSRTTEASAGDADLMDHCIRGIRRALSRRSERGIPLIGAGDWNDGLSHAGLEGRGESFWLAMFLYDILNRWDPILARRGWEADRAAFAAEAESLRTAVNDHGWDGEWYLEGTRDDGKPLGSRTCDEGKIFLNPQTWAVISGIAPPERVTAAMAAVRKHLVKPYGALLLTPAYSQVDPYVGYITRYAPGLRENGGVYSHASTWAVQAFAMVGDLETARAIYQGMLPCLRSAEDAEGYQAEPYVMPGNVDGPDSPYEGRAGWTWYTGSAAWMRRISSEWLQKCPDSRFSQAQPLWP